MLIEDWQFVLANDTSNPGLALTNCSHTDHSERTKTKRFETPNPLKLVKFKYLTLFVCLSKGR